MESHQQNSRLGRMSNTQGPMAENQINPLSTFSKSWWQFWLTVLLLGVFFAWINSLTVTADLERNGVAFESWHPYVWEFSSMMVLFCLYFAVYVLTTKAPLVHRDWPKNLAIHLLASLLFSVVHVVFMVWIRQGVYGLMGAQYDFGQWGVEFWYEYRKDVVTYFVFVLILTAYMHYLHRKSPPPAVDKQIQIKNKQGVFYLQPTDVITVESGGNYVYFHTEERVLSMRGTMAEVEASLSQYEFLRVHRSYIVNLAHRLALQKNAAESTELVMKNGKLVPVSKKYRPALIAAMEQHSLPAVD